MKKILAYVVFVFQIFSLGSPFLVYSAWGITLSTFSLRNNGWSAIDWDIAINPWDVVGALVSWENTSWDDLTNVWVEFHFSQSDDITYANPGQTSSYVWYIVEHQNIPLSEFNPPVLNSAPLASLLPSWSPVGLYYTNLAFSTASRSPSMVLGINFFADGYVGPQTSRTIYVNVKPHIVDMYFEKADGSETTNTIQWSEAESVSLVVKVKDYNGCANMALWEVNVDLSQLWLGNESLTYVWCGWDGKTATFKKTGITTSVSMWTYGFPSNAFQAIDGDGNQDDEYDARFWSEDKKNSINITVVAASAPEVILLSPNNSKVGWPEKLFYPLEFSGNQIGSYKVSLWWDGFCAWWTSLKDWTPYEGVWSEGEESIFASSLAEWTNSLYICLKNNSDNIGSVNFNIIKDTIPPVPSNPQISPGSIELWDASLKFSCNENGWYRVEVWGDGIPGNGVPLTDWLSANAGTQYTTVLPNSSFSLGSHILYAYCKDEATNLAFKTWSIIKSPPTPSMEGTQIVLIDHDFDFEGLDGRDISVSWTPTSEILQSTNFESYRIYVLPSNISLNPWSQTALQTLTDKNLNTWTWNMSLKKDSLGQNLTSWGSYKVCMVIMGTSGNYGGWECSQATSLIADTVAHATVVGAKFLSNTTLEITTDTTLDPELSHHTSNGVTYTYQGNTKTPTDVMSISWKKIIFSIPPLGDLAAVGNNLVIQTGAIRSSIGWYNNAQIFASITDGQKPTITWVSNMTSSYYNNFYSGSVQIWFTFWESMKSGGVTQVVFDRASWNPSSQKIFPITDQNKLWVGAHVQAIDLVALGLTSGTTYSVKVVWEDGAWNSQESTSFSLKFDTTWPSKPILIPQENTSNATPTLSWNASSDDGGHGSWVKEYILKVFVWNMCSGNPLQTHITSWTSQILISLSNGTYSWSVTPKDHMENMWEASLCGSFLLDTSLPTILNFKATDTLLASSSFTKVGNTLEVTADLTNTNSEHIILDISSLSGNASYKEVSCADPIAWVQCSFAWWKVTYSFVVGFAGSVSEVSRSLILKVSNTSGLNIQEKIISLTVDNTPPTLANITSPTSWIYGGNVLDLTWNGISDNNLDFIKIEYSNNSGATYHLVYSGANISPYHWDLTSLDSGNYMIKITWQDKAKNTSFALSPAFTLDLSKPILTPPLFTNISSGSSLKGNTPYTITWNAGNITDSGGLHPTPITLWYSLDNGSNWNQIATNLPNSWNYTWNIGNLNSSQVRVRMQAKDAVGNISSYGLSSVFVIDSTPPNIAFDLGTPPNGAFINGNWFDLIGNVSDNISLSKIQYSVKNITDTTFWDGTGYTGSLTWNTLVQDLSWISYNLNTLLHPTLQDGNHYELKVKVTDTAGNEFISYPREYIADTLLPNLHIDTLSNAYFSGSIQIVGTASDSGAWISSVKIAIQKWWQYWDGATWVGTEHLLSTTTSNNYVNWNYEFSPPHSDADGEEYLVTVSAYDASYKENNTRSQVLNIVRDLSWPLIAPNVFTFDVAWYHMWGESFSITWNPDLITTTGSELAWVELEYNYDGTIMPLVSHLWNTGNYSFNLPEVDGKIKIILSAYDMIGNLSNKVVSNNILIDSTPPTIESVETMDLSANGQIDAVKVVMSENIKDSTIMLDDFMLAGIGTPTAWETGNSGDDNIFILKFDNFWDTSSTPKLTYMKGTLSDLAWKSLETISNISSVDRASPRILEGKIFSNAVWIFDAIEVTFSENISPTNDIAAFTFNHWLSLTSLSMDGRKAIWLLSAGEVGTDATGYVFWFWANAAWKDSAWNIVGSLWVPMPFIDMAKPVLVWAKLFDSNQDFEADRLELEFSETLSGSVHGIVISEGNISNGVLQNNKIIYDVSGIIGTNPDLTVSYTPWNLGDQYGNLLEHISSQPVWEKISPKLLWASTMDSDGNGKIDGVLLEFSESLTGGFWDLLVEVSWFEVLNYTFSGSHQILTHLKERAEIDTDGTPSLTLLPGTTLQDEHGNILLAQSMVSQDAVWPVMVWARFDEGLQKLYLNFSESVDETLDANSFVIHGMTSNIVWVSFTPWEKNAVLDIDGTGVIYGTSEISFAANKAQDMLWNTQSSPYFIKISASLLINEVMSVWDTKYIELKNISSSVIDISWWKLENIFWDGGDFILPNGQIVPVGWYYLLASNTTSFSWVSVQQTLENLNFHSDIILKNGGILVDRWGYQTWVENVAFERKQYHGDGWSPLSWYRAVASTGFITSAYKWTPGAQNIFDVTPPELSENIGSGMILPNGAYEMIYVYSDDIEIDPSSMTFEIWKWNGNMFVSGVGFMTGSISSTQANYFVEDLPYGRYRAEFSLQDTAGNRVAKRWEFYVDQFSLHFASDSQDLGELPSWVMKYTTIPLQVTVQTIWAPFELKHTLEANDLGNWDGEKWFGWCIWGNCTLLANYSDALLVNQPKNLSSSWELHTYTYMIQYGAKIDDLTPAWVYTLENNYTIRVSY